MTFGARVPGGSGRPPLRAVRVAVAAVALLGVIAVTAGPAPSTGAVVPDPESSATTPAAGAPAAATDDRPGVGTTAFSDLPVEVTVTRLGLPDPGQAPEGELVIEGTLVNGTDDEVAVTSARVGIGRAITTRSSLAAADRQLVAASRDFTPEQYLSVSLRPGASEPFVFRVPAAEISASVTGAYPIRLQVSGPTEDGGADAVVGAVQTYLPWYASPPVPDRVAWLLPLIDVPDLGVQPDDLVDDSLPDSLGPGGRLSDLLAIAETTAAGSVTLAVDPDLVQTAQDMSDGYRVRAGPVQDGTAAATWLARLGTVAADQPVVALPFGDVDLVAAVRGGLGADALAAWSYGAQVTASALAPTGSPTPGPAAGGVVTTLAWPADELITHAALDVAVTGGARSVVLSPRAFRGSTTSPPTAASTLTTTTAPMTALVVDDALGDLVGEAATYPGGDALAVARVQAEMAVLAAAAPGQAEDVVIAPPRRWEVGASLGRALVAATTSTPWAAPTTLPAIEESGTRIDRGAVSYPSAAEGAEVGQAIVDSVSRSRTDLADFSTVLDEQDAAAFLSPYTWSSWRALSTAWRAAPSAGTAYAAALASDVAYLGTSVSVVSGGTYTVSGPRTQLPLTIANTLAVPVTVRVLVEAPNGSGFTVTDPGPIRVEAQRRLTVDVAAQSDKPGRFTLQAQLMTPEGVPLGPPSELSVRSTAYGGVVLGLTVGALVLFVVLVALRFLRRRPAGQVDGADE